MYFLVTRGQSAFTLFSRMKKRQGAKEKILGAATSEFFSHGFERAISHVAKKAHVNEVTVYRLFGNKANLQLAAMLEASRLNPSDGLSENHACPGNCSSTEYGGSAIGAGGLWSW